MSLKVWLPLDGTLENKGCSNVTLTNGTPVYKTNGKIGSCLDLSSKLTLNCSEIANITTFSIAFWTKVNDDTSLSTNWVDIISFTDATPSDVTGLLRWETCYASTHVSRGPSWHDNATYATTNQTTISGAQGVGAKNRWEHLTITVGDDVRVYRQGILECVCAAAGGHLTGAFTIGENNNINGEINDIRVYDHCLSAAEVHEIAMGLVLHYKLDGFMGGAGDNYIVNGNISNGTVYWGNWATATNRSVETIGNKKWLHFTASAGSSAYGGFNQDQYTNQNQMSIKPNTTYTVSVRMFASAATQVILWFHMRSTEGGANLSQPSKAFTIDTSHKIYSYTFNTGSHSTYTINRFNLMIGSYQEPTTDHDVYFTDVKFEEGEKVTNWTPNSIESGIDITKIQDSSGYDHNGTITGTLTVSNDSPRYNHSSYMPKTTIITHTRPVYGGVDQEWTCMMWVKLDGTAQGYQQLNNFNSGNNIVYSANSYPLLYLNSGENDYYNYGNLAVSANTWTHIAFVFKNSNATKLIYINGINQTNTNGPNKTSTPSGILDTITVGNNLTGYISDYRIYCTALLDKDIKMLYNVGMKVDNLGEVHAFEYNELGSRELMHGINITNGYTTHNSISYPYTNFNNGELYFNVNNTSASTDYIPISPSGKTYYYDIDVSINTGNQFYIGFERYDANKNSRSNNACVYVVSTKPASDLSHQHYRGTVDLSTDTVNPCAFITLRILNGWSGTTSGVTGIATIHRLSLREVSTFQIPKLYKTGTFKVDELNEHQKAAFYSNEIIEATEFIEI